MWRDVQYGLRQVRESKLFAAAVVLLLASGIGANTVIFSFVNALLLNPLPVRNPENLYLLQKMRAKQVRPDTSFFYRQFEAIAQHKEVFSSVIAEQEWGEGSFQPFTEADRIRLITTQTVSPNYFSELGVRAVIGRVLSEADSTASSEIPVVLSYQFWASEFNRDKGVIGRIIRVKNHPFLVVGILTREFHGIDVERAPDVRLPISAAAMLTGSAVTEPGGDYPIRFEILARLSRGVWARRAAAAVLSVTEQMEETLWRDWNARSTKPSSPEELHEVIAWERSYHLALLEVSRGVSQLREQFSRAVFLLMGAVGLLLLAVCANVAGLLLGRCEERKREIAVRLSVGANGVRLLRQLFVENLLLALPSTAFGVALAYGIGPWLLRLLPRPRGFVSYATPLLLDVTPDKRVLLFAIALSLITLVLFGILPARHALRTDLNEQLKGANTRTTAASPRSATVAIQVAFVGSGGNCYVQDFLESRASESGI